MGKTPLLPLFAATLGAENSYLGFIVSVSTITGMVLKPGVGLLSDRMDRRLWILVGTGFFVFMPFAYQFVSTAEQLIVVRVIHGLATAIYGPVTLALIVENSRTNTAEYLGWFGMARSASYIVGPLLAGWLLLTLEPSTVFTIIGLVASLAFVPALLLPAQEIPSEKPSQPSLLQQAVSGIRDCGLHIGIWLSGSMESFLYLITYALRTFLPIYALTQGVNIALAGTFFAIQEAVSMLAKPWCGRLGDKAGHLEVISAGLFLLSLGLVVLSYSTSLGFLLLVSVILGIAQALITPSTIAFASLRLNPNHVGVGMGLIGTLKNAGKVLGPILCGALIGQFGYTAAFCLLAFLAMLASVALFAYKLTCKTSTSGESADSPGEALLPREI